MTGNNTSLASGLGNYWANSLYSRNINQSFNQSNDQTKVDNKRLDFSEVYKQVQSTKCWIG